MRERLQKILAAAQVASRRKSEALLEAGRVAVNGVTAHLGDAADPETDEITLDGEPISRKAEHVYIALHKPRGYLCAVSDDRGRKTVTQLVEDCGTKVYPVGRLDLESEGLLLMTNDGDFANRVSHPKYQKEKTYVASVKGDTDAGFANLSEPIEIDGKETRPAVVHLIESDGQKAKIEFILKEGRNRQVRRLCEAAGLEVTRLIRVAEGCVGISGIRTGKWRYLTDEEIRSFYRNRE